ncbi:MAG: nuclear transport factor 2 family protein [Litorimonas sp.]
MMKNPKNLLIFTVLGGVVGLFFGFVAACFFTGSSASWNTKVSYGPITKVLDQQVEAWNSGDIEAYMQDYVKGEDLRFASGGNIESGWQPTLERYLKRYPDRSAMGRLETENLDIQVIDEDDALVFGTWALIRENDRPSGLYTLHLKRIDGEWVIVSDHTSSAD